ncbi:hypothetical protein ES288_D05G427500v1 [Gossypium darwinii]|uniref:Bet v I/Major latex protein domain-containing protein n=1 Tax=Gossypium darwinii TaxID=34276 RepID=A0A5D2CR49_GOSDA|nr:hypothetical protein ES288_D05G427500v1 [Gossypium darwinii]
MVGSELLSNSLSFQVLTDDRLFPYEAGNSSYTEKFTVMDDQRRVKETKGLEGDCLAIGCSVQILEFEIIEKSQNSSIIKSTISYAVKEEFQAKDPKPSIQIVEAIVQSSKKFLERNN